MRSKLFCRLSAAAILLAMSSLTFAQSKAFETGYMDKTVEACDNFYRYAVGGWLKNNPIPAAYSSWGVDNIVEKNNYDILKNILETDAKNTNAAKNSDEQLIGDFYASCMDEAAINKAGAKPLKGYFKKINSIKNADGLRQTLADLQNAGYSAAFRFGVGSDDKNSSMNIVQINQGGLSLPNRDYYTKTDEKSVKTREQFVAHVTKMFTLLGDSSDKAKANADTVMRIEMRLALASKTPVELRDPLENYHKVTIAEVNQITPNFDWNAYAKDLKVTAFGELNVGQPDFFREFGKMTTDVPIADWKTYLRWRVLTRSASRLAKPFDDENFNFYTATLRGAKEQQPRWRRCLQATDGNVGEALGQEYVKTRFHARSEKEDGRAGRKSVRRVS